MVVEKGYKLGDDSVQKKGLLATLLVGHFLEYQQMPLLVVLLMAALTNKFKDPSGKMGFAICVGHGNVGHVFPGLVWDPRYDLQNLEFRQAPFSAIEEVHTPEEEAGQKPVFHSRGIKRHLLLKLQVASGFSRTIERCQSYASIHLRMHPAGQGPKSWVVPIIILTSIHHREVSFS